MRGAAGVVPVCEWLRGLPAGHPLQPPPFWLAEGRVDLGREQRDIVSGISQHYEPEQLIGKTVRKVTLEVEEVDREVAPGVTVHMWTFNGQNMAPILRGKVGD